MHRQYCQWNAEMDLKLQQQMLSNLLSSNGKGYSSHWILAMALPHHLELDPKGVN